MAPGMSAGSRRSCRLHFHGHKAEFLQHIQLSGFASSLSSHLRWLGNMRG
jgi:hypothetical protein